MTMARIGQAIIAAGLLTGCSGVNGIDACDYELGQERVVNGRPEGEQFTQGASSLAPMPSGEALVVFQSSSDEGVGERYERSTSLRGARLDSNGERLETCGVVNEFTYAKLGEEDNEVQRRWPTIAGPTSPGGDGLLVWTKVATQEGIADEDSAVQIEGQFFDADGCPYLSTFAINTEASFLPESPAVTAVGDGEFVVAWPENNKYTARIRARVVGLSSIGAKFLPVIDPESQKPTEGEAVTLFNQGMHLQVASVGIGEGRVAVAWRVLGPVSHTYLQVINKQLEPLGPLVHVARDEAPAAPVSYHDFALAYDETHLHLLAAWVGRRADGEQAIFGALVTADGQVVRGGLGSPWELTANARGHRSEVAVTGLPQGGFAVAWSELADQGGQDKSGSRVRMVALDGAGDIRFNSLACDRDAFDVNVSQAGDQRGVELTTTTEGSLVVVWTDSGDREINARMRAELRGRAISLDRLLPTE